MRLDVTIQRQSKIINGIKVVLVASFFVAIALAVGGLCDESRAGSEILGVGLVSNDIPEPEPGNEHYVPVAQRYELGPFDTEAGEIELIDYYFPYIDRETGELLPLPLCITNEMSQTWWWDLRIKGGYTPEDTEGFWPWMGISVYQDQDKDGRAELIQGWNLEWFYEGKDPNCDCCSCEIWRGIPAWCGNKVCLDSNQYPVLMGGLENFVSEHYPECDGEVLTEIPGKEVYFEFGLKFSGCPLDEQEFAYVLAQKRCNFPNISPTPELKQ
jgi:hypothetical protein